MRAIPDGRTALVFAVGAVTPIPFALSLSRLGDLSIALGLIGCSVLVLVLFGIEVTAVRRLPRAPLTWILLGFLVFSAVSTLLGTLRFHAIGNIFSFGFQVVIVANVLVGYWFVRGGRALAAYFAGLVLTSALTAGMVVASLAAQGCWYQFHLAHNSDLLRANLYGWPNHLGVMSVVGFLGAVVLAVRSSNLRLRLTLFAAAVVLLVGIFITYSRTAYLVFALGAVMLVLLSESARRLGLHRVLVLLAAVAVTQLVGGNLGPQPTTAWAAGPAAMAAPEAASRLDLNCQVAQASEDHQPGGAASRSVAAPVVPPATINLFGSFTANLLYSGTLIERVNFVALVLRDLDPTTWVIGSGYQNNQVVFASHLDEDVIPGLTLGKMLTTHDEYLTVLIKSGAIGLGLMLAAFIAIAWRYRGLSRSSDADTRVLFVGCYATAIVILVASFAGEELHYWPLASTFWLLAGASLNFPSKELDWSRSDVSLTLADERTGAAVRD
jgi:O-antigen ligase